MRFNLLYENTKKKTNNPKEKGTRNIKFTE